MFDLSDPDHDIPTYSFCKCFEEILCCCGCLCNDYYTFLHTCETCDTEMYEVYYLTFKSLSVLFNKS